jgi:Pyruvate/2-oxoacid:ferredoxin oxidoreductase gamma subunit
MAFDLTIKIGGEGGEGVISAGDFFNRVCCKGWLLCG